MNIKLTLIFLTFLSMNCKAQNSDIIPYALSIEVEKSIYETIQNKNKDSIAFYFEALSDKKIKIHVQFDGIRDEYFFSKRKLFVNDRFYPIIFDTDYKFYLEMKDGFPILIKFKNENERETEIVKMPTIDERIKNKMLYVKKQMTVIIDQSIWWIVDSKGNLIETNSK